MKNYSEEKYNEIIGGSSNEKDIVRKICEFVIYFLRTEYETLIFVGRRIVHSHHRKCHPNFLLVGCRGIKLSLCAESQQFDLGFKPVLRFHYYVDHLEAIIMPFLDAPEVSGSALIVDDEGHGTVAQAFLEHDQSANTAITVFEGEDLLEPDMEVQDLIPLDFGLVLIVPDQCCQTGIDSAHRQ